MAAVNRLLERRLASLEERLSRQYEDRLSELELRLELKHESEMSALEARMRRECQRRPYDLAQKHEDAGDRLSSSRRLQTIESTFEPTVAESTQHPTTEPPTTSSPTTAVPTTASPTEPEVSGALTLSTKTPTGTVTPQVDYATLQEFTQLRQQVNKLNRALKCVDRARSNADDLYFVGCNVHVENGEGLTVEDNSRGNLVLGYNEDKNCPGNCTRSGSHNLVVGMYNYYAASGGIVAGSQNGIVGRMSTVTGGYNNSATGLTSSVSGVSIEMSARACASASAS